MKQKGFTLIELMIVIGIIAILSAIIMLSASHYISVGKDANIKGNLSILITSGEVFYNGNNSSYNDGTNNFCDPTMNSGTNVLANIISQMPQQPAGAPCQGADVNLNANPKGVCCYATPNAWAACAQEFSNPLHAFCVDSRGVQEEIYSTSCNNTSLTQCPDCSTQPCP